MPSDDHAVTALRIDLEGFDVVEHVKSVAEEFQIPNIRKGRCPAYFVDIATDRNQRGDLLQRFQNLVPTHVTGMKNQI
jgi:hypothetical protein